MLSAFALNQRAKAVPPSSLPQDSTKTDTLDELVIEAKWMYPKDGKLVVNVSSIPEVKRLTTDEMLRRIPGLMKSSKGSYNLDGKSVVVYINGIRQSISATSLDAFLSSLPADAIASVELTSINTGQYEAGVDAVIDIKTKRNIPLGYSLQPSLYSSTLIDRLGVAGGSLFYMTKFDRILLHSTLSYTNDWIYERKRDSLFIGNQRLLNNERNTTGRRHQITYQGTLSYQLRSGSSLNLNSMVYYDHGRTRTPWLSSRASGLDLEKGGSDYYNLALSYQIPSRHRAFYGTLAYSLGYGGQDYRTDYLDPSQHLLQHRHINMDGWMHTLSGDFNTHLGKWRLSYGLRIDRNSVSQVSLSQTPSSTTASFRQPFTGAELLTALYAQANYRLSQRLTLRVGGRLEHTNYRYELEGAKPVLNYLNIFPSLLLFYNRPNYGCTLGLVSGINRPRYEWMLPGEKRINDFLYSVGKPTVEPMHRYTLVFNNTLFSYAKLNLSYVWEQGVTGAVYTQRGATLYRTVDNIADNRSMRAYIALPFAFAARTLTGQIQANYQHHRLVNLRNGFTIPEGRQSSYFIHNYTAYISYTPTQRLGISLEGTLNPKQTTTQYSSETYTQWGVQVSYDFLRARNLTLRLSAERLIETPRSSTTYFLGNSYRLSTLSTGPVFSISLKLRLNKGQHVIEEYRDYRPSTSRLM